jgi:hypothetical protein
MLLRSHFRRCVFLAGVSLAFLSLGAVAQSNGSYRGRKYKAPPPTARIAVTLMRYDDGKPIENAAVIFHAMEGEKDTGNMELKTDEDGKTVIDVMPIGDTVRLQIIARGYQTYGGDYKIDKPQMAIAIRLKRPGQQYSIYDNHPETVDAGKSPDAASPAAPPAKKAPDEGKGAGPASGSASAPAHASQDKPAAQPDARPGASQPQPK